MTQSCHICDRLVQNCKCDIEFQQAVEALENILICEGDSECFKAIAKEALDEIFGQ